MIKLKKKLRGVRPPARLRERAEAWLEKSPRAVSETPGGDGPNLVHELRVHQAELEMQNEELRRAQLELENSRDRFAQLYNLAPVGFLTLDAEGVIREANQTAARLLGLERRTLLEKKLSRFIAAESQDDFYLHCQLVFTAAGPHACELQMHPDNGSTFTAQLEGVLGPAVRGQPAQCLVALRDVTRQRQAETAMRESQAQLATVIRTAMDGIITVNSRRRIVLCNQAAEEMFGRAAGQLMGQPLDDFIPEAAHEAQARNIRGSGTSGFTIRQISQDQTSGRRANGTVFPLEASISQFEVQGGQYVTIILRDITGRRRMEAAQARLAAIVESSEDAIVSRTLENAITTWNAGAEKLFGWSAAEIVGRPFATLTPPDCREELRQIRQAIERGELVPHLDTRRLAKNGRVIPVSSTSSAIKDAAGKITGISAILRDMTRQKKAEETLRRSEAALADFFAESPLGLLWVGGDGRILRVNRAQLAMLGHAVKEVFGRPVAKLYAHPDLATIALNLLAKKKALANQRAIFRHKDGSIRQVLIDANGLWEQGRLVHSRWFVRDITRRVELERKILRISESEQQRLGEELHDDVCQQLTGIEFLTQRLITALPVKSKIHARRAIEIAQLLRVANNRVRQMSHGLAPIRLETDGLAGALQALAQRTRQVFGKDCRVRCAEGLTIEDPQIRLHLYRIAQEAVGNAVKHGRATRINVRLAVGRKHLVLGINDNGLGLPSLPPRRKGMGLPLMQYRASLMGGSLFVQRRAAGGTSVVCSVPLAGARAKGAGKT